MILSMNRGFALTYHYYSKPIPYSLYAIIVLLLCSYYKSIVLPVSTFVPESYINYFFSCIILIVCEFSCIKCLINVFLTFHLHALMPVFLYHHFGLAN